MSKPPVVHLATEYGTACLAERAGTLRKSANAALVTCKRCLATRAGYLA